MMVIHTKATTGIKYLYREAMIFEPGLHLVDTDAKTFINGQIGYLRANMKVYTDELNIGTAAQRFGYFA